MKRSVALPSRLQRSLDAAARDFLFPGTGPVADFSNPRGEPALVPPDSVSWQVFKNPMALFVGGVAAVILELAHPSVRAGVWEHTSFRTDPRARIQRTGLAAMMTVYGPRSKTEEMITHVRELHSRVVGVTSSGKPYRADDPELLDWVHATASFGFLEAYSNYVRPLGKEERDAYFGEGMASASLYGAPGAPTSQQECDTLFRSMLPTLESSSIVFEFLDIVRQAPLLPGPLSILQRLLVKAAVNILPVEIRARLGLGRQWDLSSWQRFLVCKGGALADRVLLESTPAVQACRRLGLPDDYLYTRTS